MTHWGGRFDHHVVGNAYMLTPGTQGHAYATQIVVLGGWQPYRFEALTPMPEGLTLTRDGIVTGEPARVGRHEFVVSVWDAPPIDGGSPVITGWGLDGGLPGSAYERPPLVARPAWQPEEDDNGG
jgi:hypothetical protein